MTRLTHIQKKDGCLQSFDSQSITVSVAYALLEVHNRSHSPPVPRDYLLIPEHIQEAALTIADKVALQVNKQNDPVITVDRLHDLTEATMLEAGMGDGARAYARYRQERSETRRLLLESSPKTVTRTDGVLEPFNVKAIEKQLSNVMVGLSSINPDQVYTQACKFFREGITTLDITLGLATSASQFISEDREYDLLAGRLSLDAQAHEAFKYLSDAGFMTAKKAEEALVNGGYPVPYRGFGLLKAGISAGVDQGLLNPELLNEEKFDYRVLENALLPEGDALLTYQGVITLYKRYVAKSHTNKRYELPQTFFMRVAMGLALNESNPTRAAIQFYRGYALQRYMSSTPTLFNAGTTHSQLASCFLMDVGDDLRQIFGAYRDHAMLSKFAGGIGTSWSKVRGSGALIKGTNGESQGVVPWLKIDEEITNSVNQGGKRKGACAAYMEPWHIDYPYYLQMKYTQGKSELFIEQMNTAAWIPDLFMKRVKTKEPWTLFSPNMTPDLPDAYGKTFDKKYLAYEKKAEDSPHWEAREFKFNNSMQVSMRVSTTENPMHPCAQISDTSELFKVHISYLFSSGHPWITFKDAANIRSPQDHVGVIHSSNLCCIAGDQRVVTDAGIMTVKEMYDLGGAGDPEDPYPERMTHPSHLVMGRTEEAHASRMLKPRPNAEMVKIKTREGYSHKVTPDHKVWVKDVGWVEAQNLVAGDKLEIQQKEGLWGDVDKESLAFIVGLIAGDGGISDTSAYIDLVEHKSIHLEQEISDDVSYVLKKCSEYVAGSGAPIPASMNPVFNEVQPSEIGGVRKKRLVSVALKRLLEEHGITSENKTRIPDFVWKGTYFTAGEYLRGLLTADGCIQANGDVTTVQLGSTDLTHLEEVQILLANFGIKSCIRPMHEGGLKMLPANNGTFARKEYECKPMHRLLITSQTACKILEHATEFGRTRKHEKFLSNIKNKHGYKQKMWAVFTELEILPNEDAYCLVVENEDHDWTVNGMITKNTEILLNTKPTTYTRSDRSEVATLGEVAVCNLLSVNLVNMLIRDKSGMAIGIDLPRLQESVSTGVRMLDNVIDLSYYPIEEAENANMKHRPIGLGIMGWHHMLQELMIPYDSEEAVEMADHLQEQILYAALYSGVELAKERGPYSTFEGSKWQRGILPQDTPALLAASRGKQFCKFHTGGVISDEDWDRLRAEIKEHGLRNSTYLAIAPTATIGKIAGGASQGVDPVRANVFIETDMEKEFTRINPPLVAVLKRRGIWNRDTARSLRDKITTNYGSVIGIPEIPEDIQRVYKHALEISAFWTVKQNARRQKWIDQAISTNMYMPLRSDLYGGMKVGTVALDLFTAAWEEGMKTTYYFKTESGSRRESTTVDLSREQIRDQVSSSNVEAPEEIKACRLDDPTCEACQ